jgi:hypothetical protein
VLSPSEADQLNRAVKGSSISNGTGQHEVVYGIPFEGVLDIYNQIFPASESIIKFLKYNLAGAEPNPVHEFLAAGLVSRVPIFPRVVTLNYDQLIEEALSNADWNIIRVATRKEYQAWRNERNASLLLKLHGSFHEPDTIVATLSTEHGLAQWKRELIKQIVANKVLVVIGYSGYDFDVCPTLLNSNPKFVYWNTLSQEEAFPREVRDLLNKCGRHIIGNAIDLISSIRENMSLELRALLPAIKSYSGKLREAKGMSLGEKEALKWLARVATEVGLGEIAMRLIAKIYERFPSERNEFGLIRDEARAHFLLDHTPQELATCRSTYKRALRNAQLPLQTADIWISYHEPCRIELKNTREFLVKAHAIGGMVRALLSVLLKTFCRVGNEISRLRGYLWLRIAQDLENLIRQRSLSSKSWLGSVGYTATEWLLLKASRCFKISDNYFGTLQVERIRLRVSSAPYREQLQAVYSLRDYYRRLGYLTGWSNSNRDVIEVMRKSVQFDVAEARRLAQEAIEVSKLAGDRPGLTKAADLLAKLFWHNKD